MLGPALVLLAYLLGSISFGLIAARRAGVDLRAVGSGNIGATNVGRALGGRAGAIVLFLDALKGLLPVLVARLAMPGEVVWIAAVGVAAVVGHIAPIWHRLRGGKGVATAAGVLLVAIPTAGALLALTYFAIRRATRTSSLGSLGGVLVASIATIAVGDGRPWPDPPGSRPVLSAFAGVLTVLVFLRHVGNIRRLLAGEENIDRTCLP